MASVDDYEELIATRKLNSLDDDLYKKSDKNVANMTEKAFNEIIDNFEVVAYLTEYGRKGIKDNVRKLQARIKELEDDLYIANYLVENSISKQKVKDFIKELKLSGGSDGKDNVENLARELAIEILQELLEENK